MNTNPQDPWRRCALLLHALQAQDRQWLMDQMTPVHRTELEALVCELQALGIPPDRSMARVALTARPSTHGTSLSKPGEAACITGAHEEDLSMVLADEPPGLVAEALRDLEPARRESVLVRLGAARRLSVEAWSRAHGLPGEPGEASLLRQAVLAELTARLAPLNAVRRRSLRHIFRHHWRAARTRIAGAAS